MVKPWEKYQEPAQPSQNAPWLKYQQVDNAPQQQAAPQERAPLFTAENPLGAVGRAATKAFEDTAAIPIRAAKNIAKGTVGGLVDLANIAPQAINILPNEQGVKPISENPVLGSQFIEDAFKGTFGQLSQPQTRLGATADLATEVASGFAPIPKAFIPAAKGLQPYLEKAAEIPVSGIQNRLAKMFGVDAEKVKAIEEGGLSPNIPAVGGNVPKRVQNTLAIVPGSSGVIERASKNTLDKINKQIRGAIDTVGTPTTFEGAGSALQSGVDKAVERFRTVASKKYDAFDAVIPKQNRFPIQKLTETLSKQGEGLTPALREAFENPKIKPIIAAIAKDAPDGALPFETVKSLRTRIGEMLTDKSLVTDLPRVELKRMYGALSEDLKNAAILTSPDALKKFNDANDFYATNIKRIDRYFERVNQDKKTAEQAFKALQTNSKEGGTILRNTLQGLPSESASTVRATLLENLGKADSSADFSSTRFLNGYKKLAPEAKKELFKTQPELQMNLDKLSKAVDVLGSVKQFENFSRTAETNVTAGLGATAGSAMLQRLLAGDMAGAATVAATGALSYKTVQLSARALQSPRFTRWLAQAATKKTDAELANHLTKLKDIAKKEPNITNDIKAALLASKLKQEEQK